jgi:hypothetical protein
MKNLVLFLLLSPVAAGAQCLASGSLYTADYFTSGATVLDDEGTQIKSTSCTDIRNGWIDFPTSSQCRFYTARCGHTLRASCGIPAVSDNSWTMDFKLEIHGPPKFGMPNCSPGVNLAVLSAGNSDLVTVCPIPWWGNNCTSCGTYPNTNMDAIWVMLNSTIPSTSCVDGGGWYFQAFARDGSAAPSSSGQIAIPTGDGTYYIRLMRSNSNAGMLSVYSDANYSIPLAGSPTCFTVPGSVTGLNTLSHGIAAQGGCTRIFNGTISDLKIDNGNTCPTGLFPSFVFTVCNPNPGSQALVVNGSASTWSGTPITSYYWEAVPVNGFGVPVGPYEIFWGSGAPGSYTFTTTPPYMPGAIIRVKLAIQSCGNVWSEVVHLGCVATRMADPGLQTEEIQAVSMYPNPTSGKLFINFGSNSEETYSLRLLDLSGRLIAERTIAFTSGSGQIELDLANGIYIAELVSKEGKIEGMQRIVISK